MANAQCEGDKLKASQGPPQTAALGKRSTSAGATVFVAAAAKAEGGTTLLHTPGIKQAHLEGRVASCLIGLPKQECGIDPGYTLESAMPCIRECYE